MTVCAPPRPPRPSDPVERDEFEALIEEARQRARRRRRLYGCVIIAAIGAAVAAYLGWGATLGRSEADASTAVATRPGPAARGTTKIAFVRDRDGDGAFRGDIEMYVTSPDGSGRQRLTRNASPLGRPPVCWSLDGRKIAFASERSGNPEIYVMNADGSGERRLTRSAGLDVYPVWSPDGRKIAFISDRHGGLEVEVMNAEGSGRQRLTRNVAPGAPLFPGRPTGGRSRSSAGAAATPRSMS